MKTPRTDAGGMHGIPISDAARAELLAATKEALDKCAKRIGKAATKAQLPDGHVYCVPFLVTKNMDCSDPETIALVCLSLIGRGDAMALIYASRNCEVCNEIARMPHVAIVDGFRMQLQLRDAGKIAGADCQGLIELVREAIEP